MARVAGQFAVSPRCPRDRIFFFLFFFPLEHDDYEVADRRANVITREPGYRKIFSQLIMQYAPRPTRAFGDSRVPGRNNFALFAVTILPRRA